MPRDTRLPPLLTDGVFSASGSVVISATRKEVWDVVFDFKSYPEWNPFARKTVLSDSSGKPHPEPTPAEGKYLLITANTPPTMGYPGLFGESHPFAVITVIDHDNYRAAWELAPTLLSPSWLLRSERWQILAELPDGKTKYETFEVFDGPLAHVLNFFIGAGIRQGFQAFADSLKLRVERTKVPKK